MNQTGGGPRYCVSEPGRKLNPFRAELDELRKEVLEQNDTRWNYRTLSPRDPDRQRRAGAIDELLLAPGQEPRRSQNDEPGPRDPGSCSYDGTQHSDPDLPRRTGSGPAASRIRNSPRSLLGY